MLVDSVRSEIYRLLRNRMAVFWSVLFVPLLFVVGGLVFHMISKGHSVDIQGAAVLPSALTANAPVNLMNGLSVAVSSVANGGILVFLLIAAATLYAGDYRWETWRLISARNSRTNHLLGKVAVFKLTALATMILFLIGGLVFSLTEALVNGKSLIVDANGLDLGQFFLLILIGWVRIAQYAMIALLTAVVTRSMLATLFVPVALGFVQSLVGGPGMFVLGWQPSDWQAQLTLPGLAYDTLKAAITQTRELPEGMVFKSVLSLSLWLLVPLAAAIAVFNRQDLSKE